MSPVPRLPLLLFCLLPALLAAEQLTVEVRKGDGMYSLLRRYRLVDYGCNITRFRALNKLRPNAKLLVGRTYQLPVEVYRYDGTSIRSTTGNDDWDRAVLIKEYNEALHGAGLRERDYRKDRILYVPYHIDHCLESTGPEAVTTSLITEVGENTLVTDIRNSLKAKSEERPPIAVPEQVTTIAPRVYSIFGDEYAEVPLVDDKLAGRVFYIVAGHGGPDPGAVGRRGGHQLAEDEYAYDVALRLCRNILQHGGIPYMIVRDENDGIRDEKYLKADKDETVWGGAKLPRNQKLRLFQRSDIINALYDENLAKGLTDQTMIAIHVDSRQRGQRIDLFLYYPEGDAVGASRAQQIQRTMRRMYDTHRPGRGYSGTVTDRDLHMLRETKPSGIYIELANIANSSDQVRIIDPRNRQLLADWLTLGLMD
jgi:N-acetylmuramoyl-L-alanine amidase